MPATTVSDTPATAFSIPAGAYGVIIANESDVDIHYRLSATASNDADATKGVTIPPGSEVRIAYRQPLVNACAVNAYHTSTGDKDITYDPITRELTTV